MANKKTTARRTTSRKEATPGARMRAELRDHIIGGVLSSVVPPPPLGVVIPATPPSADPARPALAPRPQLAFRPGMTLPGGPADRFPPTPLPASTRLRPAAPEPPAEDHAPLKINMQ